MPTPAEVFQRSGLLVSAHVDADQCDVALVSRTRLHTTHPLEMRLALHGSSSDEQKGGGDITRSEGNVVGSEKGNPGSGTCG